MHSIPFELAPPRNEADFERMCAHVYGVVFNDRTPRINGRRGQAQGGVDVFVKEPGVGRIGIQCKKYTAKPVTWQDVLDEVKKADDYKTPVKKLLLATTAPNDAVLLKKVQELSDLREDAGLFSIEIEFWDDICLRIEQYPVLQDSYIPNAPGAAYHRQETKLGALYGVALETQQAVIAISNLPIARQDSADRIISAQLDRTNELLRAYRYQDALEHLIIIGNDLAPFDAHQKARWHLQRGLAIWLSRSDDERCAELFIKAYELYPDDDRMVAAHVRGLMIQGKLEEALNAGLIGQERFPNSHQVWFSLANVRQLQGEHLKLADVPEDMRNEPDTLQFLAQAELKTGNLDEAIELSRRAAEHQSASFFARATALRIAVDCGSRYPVGAAYGAFPDREFKALQFSASLFDPRQERLWAVQSEAVLETATQLCYVLLMLQRFEEALSLSREASARFRETPELLRVQFTVLFELDREDELLTLAEAQLETLNADSLSSVGQVASKRGNLDLLARAHERACKLPAPHFETNDLLAALKWDAMVHAGQRDTAVNDILSAQIEVSGSLVQCCVAARVLARVGRAVEANTIVDRAKTLVNDISSAADKLMLAELLFAMKQWGAAAALFEQLVIPGRLSELHNRLLACHIRSHNRKRAKELISRLPNGWIDNDETRHLAIDLGQQAVDWEFLKPLAEAQVARQPQSVGAWLLRLSVALNSATPPEFQNDLRNVPEVLKGTVRTLTQLATIEIRYGEIARGMRRLYRMARLNMDDPEALSKYFIAIVSARTDLPLMEDALPTVQPGSAIKVQDELGQILEIVLDPDDIGELPLRDGFLSSQSDMGKALLGAASNQEVALPMRAFGDVRSYKVVGIQSAYRRMLVIAQERANSVGGLPDLKSVHMGKEPDGEFDLSEMRAEVRRSAEISREIFERYASGMLTIGGFCFLQGRTPVDVALGWPTDGPPIFVAAGTQEERDKGLALLTRAKATYVVDSLTIAELVNLGVAEVLGKLPKVLVSSLTKALLEQKLLEAEDDRSIATSTEVNGEIAFIEHSSDRRQRLIEFCKAMLQAMESYCEVKPAYGELDQPELQAKLADVLQDEELELLMLAKAENATLVTLDGRLRVLLEATCKVNGIWPQLLVMHYAREGLVDPAKAASASIQQFLNNRTFVSLSALDLVWMTSQGGAYLQVGLQRFKTYSSSKDTEFESTAAVALEFIGAIAHVNIQIGALGEIFEHVMEGLLRHPSRAPMFFLQVSDFVDDLTVQLNRSAHPYAPADAYRLARIHMQRRYLADSFASALKHASEPECMRPIKVKVLFCSKVPWLCIDNGLLPGDPNKEATQKASMESEVQTQAQSSLPPVADGTESGSKNAYLVASPQPGRLKNW